VEIRDAPGQLIDRKIHRAPQSRQRAEIVQCRAPHPVFGRTHPAECKSANSKFKKSSQTGTGLLSVALWRQ
jgi:hypothetical protein